MYDDPTCPLPTGRCADQTFRLAVYEAGHALTARALGLRLISLRMLPRPPVLISDKPFARNNWNSFVDTLETRIIELFGGQIAEEHACDSNTCCSGDIARIDELCRLVAALTDAPDYETVMFDLEDAAKAIFADPAYRDAIVPIAQFLHARVRDGESEVDGPDIEAELNKYVPSARETGWLGKMLSFGRR